MDKKVSVKQLMASLERRLEDVKKHVPDTVAFELQDIWDTAQFARDANPDFNFTAWRNDK